MRCQVPALSTIAYRQVGLREREDFENTDVAMGDLSDGRQNYCTSVSGAQQ